jgi:hypothetical protein
MLAVGSVYSYRSGQFYELLNNPASYQHGYYLLDLHRRRASAASFRYRKQRSLDRAADRPTHVPDMLRSTDRCNRNHRD